jgi:hypothetical protein
MWRRWFDTRLAQLPTRNKLAFLSASLQAEPCFVLRWSSDDLTYMTYVTKVTALLQAS